MSRTVPILILVLISVISGDQIYNGAFKRIFPYATPATVNTLTANVNKATNITKAKTVLNNWIPKNWKAPTAVVNASNPLSKQAYAKSKAVTFIEMRYSLKKFINYLANQLINIKYLTKAEGETMKKLFWTEDKLSHNDNGVTCPAFIGKASVAIVKTPKIEDKLNEYTDKFAQVNAKDWANLQWRL